MKEERKDNIMTILPAVLLTMILITPDIAVHVAAPNPKAETVLSKSRKIAVNAEAPEQKSKNEIQYEKLLLEEQALLEEIRLLQKSMDTGSMDTESIQENKLRTDALEDELYKIQISKRVLEARMETESCWSVIMQSGTGKAGSRRIHSK